MIIKYKRMRTFYDLVLDNMDKITYWNIVSLRGFGRG